jgi:hypothetical protein
MDVWTYDGRRFEIVTASDVIRDGMGLELTELDVLDPGPVLEAFWHDDGSGFEFIAHRSARVPFALVERFIDEARKRLPATGLA